MRENRTSGSEGGGTETNRSFLPLSRLGLLQAEQFESSPFENITLSVSAALARCERSFF